ncbi:MAG TPA: energy-coupling factor ABC transporter permease, partial [Armatimonadota bacterium]|nr:energy-coupling factor ABC transporter permease [Armatimonadota bacterium]
MSHLHIPDGVLPLWLVLLGWGITALLLALITRRLRAEEMTRRLPLLGVISALMLISMSAEI